MGWDSSTPRICSYRDTAPTPVSLLPPLTPLIAAWLVTRGDGSLWLVSSYAVVVAAISLVSARLLPETAGRDLDENW